MTVIENKQPQAFKARLAASLRGFWSDCTGSTAIEYVVAGVVIAVGLLAGISVLNEAILGLVSSVAVLIVAG